MGLVPQLSWDTGFVHTMRYLTILECTHIIYNNQIRVITFPSLHVGDLVLFSHFVMNHRLSLQQVYCAKEERDALHFLIWCLLLSPSVSFCPLPADLPFPRPLFHSFYFLQNWLLPTNGHEYSSLSFCVHLISWWSDFTSMNTAFHSFLLECACMGVNVYICLSQGTIPVLFLGNQLTIFCDMVFPGLGLTCWLLSQPQGPASPALTLQVCIFASQSQGRKVLGSPTQPKRLWSINDQNRKVSWAEWQWHSYLEDNHQLSNWT